MIINDICDVKEFTKDILLMPTVANMQLITKRLYNANKNVIDIYNEKNKVN